MRNDAHRPGGNRWKNEDVVAAVDLEIRVARVVEVAAQARRLRGVAHGVLDRDDAIVACERDHRGALDAATGASRDVVDDQGHG